MGSKLIAGAGLVALLGCTFDTSGLDVEFDVPTEDVNYCASVAREELRREFLDRHDLTAYCRRFVSGALDKIEACLAEGGDPEIYYECEHADVDTGYALTLEEATENCVMGMAQTPPNEYSGMGGRCTGLALYEE